MPESARVQTTELVDRLYDGKLRLERRNGATIISARAFLQGKLVRKSTGESNPKLAAKIATTWYLELLDKIRTGTELHGKTFEDIADAFLLHAD